MRDIRKRVTMNEISFIAMMMIKMSATERSHRSTRENSAGKLISPLYGS
jgi:hypothetical protein